MKMRKAIETAKFSLWETDDDTLIMHEDLTDEEKLEFEEEGFTLITEKEFQSSDDAREWFIEYATTHATSSSDDNYEYVTVH